jgi:hypothetical protein
MWPFCGMLSVHLKQEKFPVHLLIPLKTSKEFLGLMVGALFFS